MFRKKRKKKRGRPRIYPHGTKRLRKALPDRVGSGAGQLALSLVSNLGLGQERACWLVSDVIGRIKAALIEGKHVEIEGLGTLTIVNNKQRRVVYKKRGKLPVPPGVYTLPKHAKTIKLKVKKKR